MTGEWRNLLDDWIGQRSGREKVLIGAGVAIVFIWMGIVAVWQPLDVHRENLESRNARLDSGLAALKNPDFNPPETQLALADVRPIPVVITDTAAVFKLVIRRLEAEGSGARVVLEETTFQQVILWLEALEQEHGLHVRDLEMTRRPAPGIVSVTLALER